MKNNNITLSRNIPAANRAPDVQKMQKAEAEPAVDNGSFAIRASQTEDKINLAGLAPQLAATYTNIQNLSFQEEIILPKDCSYLDLKKIKKFTQVYPSNIDIGNFKCAVNACDDLNEIVDMLKWSDERSDKGLILSFIKTILECCPFERIKGCQYLTKSLKLKVYPQVKCAAKEMIAAGSLFSFETDEFLITDRYFSGNSSISIIEKLAQKFIGKSIIAAFACQRDNLELMDTTFQYMLKNADKFLKLIETNGISYQESLNKLFPIINLLVPKYQALYISKFKEHLTKTPQISHLVSDILISNGEYALAVDIYDTKENLEMQISNELTAHLIYTVTVSLVKLKRFDKAFLYAEKLYKMLPQKPDVLKLFFSIALNLDKYDVVGKIVQNVENIDLRILLTIVVNIGCLRETISQHMFRNVRYSEIPAEFREFFLVVRFANDQEQKRSSASSKTIDTAQFRRDIEVLRAESGLVLEDMLSLCMYFEQYDTANDLLSKINPELVKQNPSLQGYKSLLQARNNSKLIEEIATYPIEEDEKANLHFSAASSCIELRDLEGADAHLYQLQ